MLLSVSSFVDHGFPAQWTTQGCVRRAVGEQCTTGAAIRADGAGSVVSIQADNLWLALVLCQVGVTMAI
jgi:hypothetical protein